MKIQECILYKLTQTPVTLTSEERNLSKTPVQGKISNPDHRKSLSEAVLNHVVLKLCNSSCYRRIMIAIQSAGSSNIVQHLFSAYNYEFD